MAMKKDLEVTGVFHMTESLVIDKYCIPLCVSISLFYMWSNELINFFSLDLCIFLVNYK